GTLAQAARIRFMQGGGEFQVQEVGVFRPALTPVTDLQAGEVGYFAAAIRDVRETRVGDTVTGAERPAATSLPGYRPAQPMVFSGLYPVDSQEYGRLKEALEKLQLNDAALVFEPETSEALGFGFRAGFLGLLHLEVVQERIEREYGLALITTAPNVAVRVRVAGGRELSVDNPARLPPAGSIEALEEPFVNASIIVPSEYIGAVMDLAQDRRGEYRDMTYLDPKRVLITYRLPLSEIMYDFFDQLKSRTRGYASFDYTFDTYRESDLVRLDILLNGEVVDALSVIVHRQKAEARGRALVVGGG
ncbi:MAG: elongation factor 4, partial [Firmicutes bacterium]|nr:elongation factor 4 [Bacillota bacterium]